jgi:hypothetical protein
MRPPRSGFVQVGFSATINLSWKQQANALNGLRFRLYQVRISARELGSAKPPEGGTSLLSLLDAIL